MAEKSRLRAILPDKQFPFHLSGYLEKVNKITEIPLHTPDICRKAKRFINAFQAGLLETDPVQKKLGGFADPYHEKKRQEKKRKSSKKEQEMR